MITPDRNKRTAPINFMVFLYAVELKKPFTLPEITASITFELTRSI